MGSIFSKGRPNIMEGIDGSPTFTQEQRVEVEGHESPRFESDDPALVEYLDEHGYVVIKSVASAEEIETATRLLWKFLKDQIGMMRTKPRSWTQVNFQNVGIRSNGILAFGGIQQSEFLWYIRLLPKVKEPFEKIFGTSDLITSFDGGNIFRPWHSYSADSNSKTECGWWHVDQGKLLRGRHAVQGLVTLQDVNTETGGFCVIPGSHRYHDELLEEINMRGEKNFVYIPSSFHALQEKQIMPFCRAGDLILWDSRTIHCNTPALVYPASKPTDSFLRTVAYVCMTPSSFASPEVIAKRKLIFELGDGTSHWPHIIPHDIDDQGREKVANIGNISKEQRDLIIGRNWDKIQNLR